MYNFTYKLQNLKIFFVSSAILLTITTYSQDLDNIGSKEIIKAGGSLNYSSIFYNAYGIPVRRQPFTWFLNGTLTTNFLGISLPFTFNFNNNELSYTQPSRIQSLNPKYKWIQGYVGVTSMNFSKYTLAGQIFSGAGIELKPKNFLLSIMYGRLKKEVSFNESAPDESSYRRMGTGIMTGYAKNGREIKLIWFESEDKKPNTPFPAGTITREHNVVLSADGKIPIGKKFRIEGEYAISGLTRNVKASTDLGISPQKKMWIFFSPNATSEFMPAFRTAFGYNTRIWNLKLNYEKVSPGYTTHGGYFFNNDLENITLAPSFTLKNGKINFSSNCGLQRNNLNKTKINTTRRIVGSMNLNWAPSSNWNLGASYSNFNSFTRKTLTADPFSQPQLDSMNFFQISRSASLNVLYRFGKGGAKHSISTSVMDQKSTQLQGKFDHPGLFGTQIEPGTPSIVRILNSSWGFSRNKFNTGLSFNTNFISFSATKQVFLGPGIQAGRTLYRNKIRTNIASIYNIVFTNGAEAGEVLNNSLSISWSPKFKKESLGRISASLRLNFMQSFKINSTSGFSEFNGNAAINYSF